MDALRSDRAVVFGHDLLSLLAHMGGTANVEALRNAAAGAFGPEAVYSNCHGDRFSFHEVLDFLAARGKLGRREDEVFLGTAPACSGH
jgi:probable metal-binding protein